MIGTVGIQIAEDRAVIPGATSLARIFAAVTLACIVLPSAHAATLNLAWDPNPEDDLAKYRVYYAVDGVSPMVMEVSEPQVTLPVLIGQTYYIYVTAVGATGTESAPSETIYYTVPLPEVGLLTVAPRSDGVRVRGIGTEGSAYLVLGASDPVHGAWLPIGVAIAGIEDGTIEFVDPLPGKMRFYRLERTELDIGIEITLPAASESW